MLSCHHCTLSMATALLFTLAVLISHASVTSAECACQDRSTVRFNNMKCKPGEINAIDHRQHDVGLVGDCLPAVPDANERLCYRIRVKDCDDFMKCTYRNRGEKTSLTTLSDVNTTTVHFKSPGKFDEKKYRNNDFCIYNVSTNCSGKHIVVQTADTTDLNDTFVDSSGRRRCSDYLEFDFAPGHFLCGDELNNYTSPPLPQSSFLAVFWTSNKGNKGRFEISTECTDIPIPPTETTMSSGDEADDDSDDPSGDFPDQDEHSSSFS